MLHWPKIMVCKNFRILTLQMPKHNTIPMKIWYAGRSGL